MNNAMIPVGYMAKRVVSRPDNFANLDVVDIYSVSGCISNHFTDFIPYWKHNGYWFFDSKSVIEEIANENAIDLKGTMLFYCEVYKLELHEQDGWRSFQPDTSFATDVQLPASKRLQGYDIVTFSLGNSAECSPLSCNYLSNRISVNKHCLLPSFAEAFQLLNDHQIYNCEAGPYRIIAVYSVSWNND